MVKRAFGMRAPESGLGLCYDLAPLVYGAATNGCAAVLDLGVLTFVFQTGIGILDDLADGDLDPRWAKFNPNELVVVATSLMAATSHAIAASLHDSPVICSRLHLRIARGVCEMADGQIADIANARRSEIRTDDVFASVAGKTGAECAMYAGLGAILAGAPPERIEHYEQFALEYGMANQFATDVGELFYAAESRDLANGTRSLPIVWLLETLSEASRKSFLETLDDAKSNPLAAARVRELMIASSVLRRSILQIMIHLEKARSALTRAHAEGPAAALLEKFIDDLLAAPALETRPV